MKTFLVLDTIELEPLPSKFYCDGRFDPQLVRYIINNYSKVNDRVFDPFMGYGSVIIESENLNRIGYGFEIDNDRFNYAKGKIKSANNIICDNIYNISNHKLPLMDLCFTSPTYSWKNMGYNPLSLKDNTYQGYLNELKNMFIIISEIMKDDSFIIIDTSNIRIENVNTTLAFDVKNKLEEINCLEFQNELVVCWNNKKETYMGGSYGFGYDHNYCLIFKKVKK